MYWSRGTRIGQLFVCFSAENFYKTQFVEELKISVKKALCRRFINYSGSVKQKKINIRENAGVNLRLRFIAENKFIIRSY